MNEENKEEIIEVEEETASVTQQKTTRKPILIVLTLIGVGVLGALLFFVFRNREGGQPVPAPRTVDFGTPADSTNELAAGQTLTLQPEQLQNAGLKIETVGEQINTGETTALATGVVRANAYQETPVISLVGGVVRQINVQAGENISKGQTVAVIFSNEFAETQSRYIALLTTRENARRNFERTNKLIQINQTGRGELEQAERQLKTAEAVLNEMNQRFDRTTKLVKIGAASREELEQDSTKLRTAEAEVNEARLRFERSKKVLAINPNSRTENEEVENKLRTAESEIATVRQKLLLYGMSPERVDSLRSVSQITSLIPVTATVSGTVTNRSVNPGEVIPESKELARITNLSSVWVIAQVYEKDLARIRTGSGASVTSDAFPDRIFRGTVTYIDPRFDETTRTAQVRVELANPNNALKIGMYVRIAFGALGDMERTAPVILASAVQTINNQTIVFAATSQPNVFELRPVRLGSETGGQYQVLEGLNVGDRVVTEGSFMLRAEWLKTQQGGTKHQHG